MISPLREECNPMKAGESSSANEAKRTDCVYYTDCLGFAGRRLWNGISCEECPFRDDPAHKMLFESEEKQTREDWGPQIYETDGVIEGLRDGSQRDSDQQEIQ